MSAVRGFVLAYVVVKVLNLLLYIVTLQLFKIGETIYIHVQFKPAIALFNTELFGMASLEGLRRKSRSHLGVSIICGFSSTARAPLIFTLKNGFFYKTFGKAR